MSKDDSLHLRGVNGLRAIAALSVLIAHITGELKAFGLNPLLSEVKENHESILMASYGVTIFFALSGFLITYLLLIEKEKNRGINIKHFYIRRILRIWPLYYLFIFLCLISLTVFDVKFSYDGLPYYIFLLANLAMILNVMLPYMGHLWSIGVEEQFYLFWPWVAKMENKRLLKISILFVFVFYGIKVILYFLNFKYKYLEIVIVTMSVTRFHIMLIGCIAGILYFNKSKWISYMVNIKTQIVCWVVLACAALNIFHVSSFLFDHEAIAIITVMIIVSQISRKNYIVDLDNKIFDFIGRISYGIYVIHPLIIFFAIKVLGKFEQSDFLNYLFIYLFLITVTILISYVSYYFYEKRFILLKSRFAKIKTVA